MNWVEKTHVVHHDAVKEKHEMYLNLSRFFIDAQPNGVKEKHEMYLNVPRRNEGG